MAMTVGAVTGATLASSAAATLFCEKNDYNRGPVVRTGGAALVGLMGAFGGALIAGVLAG